MEVFFNYSLGYLKSNFLLRFLGRLAINKQKATIEFLNEAVNFKKEVKIDRDKVKAAIVDYFKRAHDNITQSNSPNTSKSKSGKRKIEEK